MNRQVQHHHHHAPPDYNRAFAVGVTLNVAFVIVEAVYGVMSDSLALLTDAGHNLSDVLGLLLAYLWYLGKQLSVERIAESDPGRAVSEFWFSGWKIDQLYDRLVEELLANEVGPRPFVDEREEK